MITITITNTIASKVGSSGGAPPAPVPPTDIAAPIISGSNVVGQLLTTTDGTWTGTAPIAYTYQWKRNGSDIVGETSSFYTLVQADATFNITCEVTATNIAGSASVSSNTLTILDADVDAFLTASAITNPTIVNATNQLVVSLKGYSIYTKFYALHLYVGGTSSTHKWNLINPLDTNAAYRIEWIGGVTHDSDGIKGNGTNGYGETYLKPSTNLIQNNTHIAFYNRTNLQNANAPMGIQDGALNASLRIVPRNVSNQSIYSVNDNTGSVVSSVTDSRGFYVASRTASNARKLYKNGAVIQTATTVSVARSTATIPVLGQKGATNTMGAYLAVNFALSSTGEAFNDTEAANYYTAVQAFQTALGRQV